MAVELKVTKAPFGNYLHSETDKFIICERNFGSKALLAQLLNLKLNSGHLSDVLRDRTPVQLCFG